MMMQENSKRKAGKQDNRIAFRRSFANIIKNLQDYAHSSPCFIAGFRVELFSPPFVMRIQKGRHSTKGAPAIVGDVRAGCRRHSSGVG
jgi:hypothetical protein